MENRIKELRETKGLSSRALAKKVGTSAVQMGRLEKGQCKLTLEWMLRVSEALDVPPNELVDIDLGAPTSKCDQALMGVVISSVLQAAEKAKNKPAAKEMAGWISFIYDTAAQNHLKFQEIRELASTIVKVSKKGVKSSPFVVSYSDDEDDSESKTTKPRIAKAAA